MHNKREAKKRNKKLPDNFQYLTTVIEIKVLKLIIKRKTVKMYRTFAKEGKKDNNKRQIDKINRVAVKLCIQRIERFSVT